MSNGNNLIIGQDNSSESTTRLSRFGEDTDSLQLYIVNEGDSLRADSFLGTAVEGQNLGLFGTGLKGTSRTGPGALGRSSTGPGVRGTTEQAATNLQDGIGVHGIGRNGATGVLGITEGADPKTGIGGAGVHGVGPVPGFAGLFDGQVRIGGTLAVAGSAFVNDTLFAGTIEAQSKLFRIDHPLDPANKYLTHTVVESSDMKNVYDGVVSVDANGEASVELPEWFEALNRDFRYQLTAIGAPGPNLYIAQEVSHNQFKIGGGAAGMKVSWQVTGIRKDNWAEAHRNAVEQEKPTDERGLYLHPELYGESEERRIVRGGLQSSLQIEEQQRQMEEHKHWIEADGAEVEVIFSQQKQPI
ncbi:MAG: hypothetical protein PHY16_17450 [Methylobacter sp.]|nr:hypothetical protein [Methylobacter sp.]